MQERSRKSPPQAPSPTESPHLLRELMRARSALIGLHAAYIYGDILLRQELPGVARLLDAAARSAEDDAIALGMLLREQNASHAVSITLRDTPYPLSENADFYPPSIVLQLLKDRIRDEKNLYTHLSTAEKHAAAESTRHMLSCVAEHVQERIAAMEGFSKKLAVS